MSIKKYRPDFKLENGTLKHAPKPYTQILNKVLQECKNSDALALWCMLQSRPENWKINFVNIQSHFDWSRQRTSNAMQFLLEKNLVQKRQCTRANGQYDSVDWELQNGEDFNNIQVHKVCTVSNEKPAYRNPTAGNPTPGNLTTTNKRIKKSNIKTNKKKILSASNDAQNRFIEFWNEYPLKKNRVRSERIWVRGNLDSIADQIIKDIKNRKTRDAQWDNKQYIPHPSTYLNGEMWQDDIVDKSQSTKKSINEPYSAVNKSTFYESSQRDNQPRDISYYLKLNKKGNKDITDTF